MRFTLRKIEELNTLKPSNNDTLKIRLFSEILIQTQLTLIGQADKCIFLNEIQFTYFSRRSYYVASTNPQTFFNPNND